jgi:hypothetical protein
MDRPPSDLNDNKPAGPAAVSPLEMADILRRTVAIHVRLLRAGTAMFEEPADLTVDDPAEVAELAALLTVKPATAEYRYCMCPGNPFLELIDAGGARVAVVTIHHSRSIRVDRYRRGCNAELRHPARTETWLRRHGLPAR